MAKTPDRMPGPSDEEAILFEDTAVATVAGEVRYASGQLSIFDGTGEYDPRDNSRYLENAANEINAEDLAAVDGGNADRVMVTTGTGGWVISSFALINALPIEFQHDDDIPLSSTSSTVYQSKIILTTTALEGGDYIVFYNAEVSGSQNGTVMKARAAFDGITPFGEMILKSASNASSVTFAGHESFVGVTAGVHTIAIQWARNSGGGSAEIQNAHISLWRVA